jgi:hypothetical protein
VLPVIAASSKHEVNPQQELVRGHWCHILECPGRDRLWLDCDRGCSIVTREIFEPKEGRLAQRIEASKHREVQPDIWVPTELRNVLFDIEGSPPPDGKPLATSEGTLSILEVRLNEDVADETFRFRPRPASIETFEDESTKQTVPGGTDYLDELVDWSQRHFDLSGTGRPEEPVASVVLEYGILGGGFLVGIGMFLRRSPYQRRSPR